MDTSQDAMAMLQMMMKILEMLKNGALGLSKISAVGINAIAKKITNAITHGEITFKNFKKVTDGDMTILQVSDENVKELRKILGKQNLTFSTLPDLDLDNGLKEVAVDLKDLPLLTRFLESQEAKSLGVNVISAESYVMTGAKEEVKNKAQEPEPAKSEPKPELKQTSDPVQTPIPEPKARPDEKVKKQEEPKVESKSAKTKPSEVAASVKTKPRDVAKNTPVIDLDKKTIKEYKDQYPGEIVAGTIKADRVQPKELGGKQYYEITLAGQLNGKSEVHVTLPENQVQFAKSPDTRLNTNIVAFAFHVNDKNVNPYIQEPGAKPGQSVSREAVMNGWTGKGNYQEALFKMPKAETQKGMDLAPRAVEQTKDAVKDIFAK